MSRKSEAPFDIRRHRPKKKTGCLATQTISHRKYEYCYKKVEEDYCNPLTREQAMWIAVELLELLAEDLSPSDS